MGLLFKIIILFFAIICLHFLANIFGIYDKQIEAGFVWFDDVLHVLVGIAFGLLWFWVVTKKKVAISSVSLAVQTIVFVFILAITWEIFELVFFKSFTFYAYNLKIYSPSIREATTDILSNITGGVIILFLKDKFI